MKTLYSVNAIVNDNRFYSWVRLDLSKIVAINILGDEHPSTYAVVYTESGDCTLTMDKSAYYQLCDQLKRAGIDRVDNKGQRHEF